MEGLTAETKNTACIKVSKETEASYDFKTGQDKPWAEVHLTPNCADTDTGFLGKSSRSASNTLGSECFDAAE